MCNYTFAPSPPHHLPEGCNTQTDSISLFGNFVLTAFRGVELEGRGQTSPKEDRLNQYLDVPYISMISPLCNYRSLYTLFLRTFQQNCLW